MGELGQTLAIIFLFTLIGGFFAASETALVSLRESQVERLVESDRRRGPRLQALMRNPNRFLAAVQVGVTLAGFISAAFGANRIAPHLSPLLQGVSVPVGVADSISFVAATLLIVYISLVLGELVPKRLALQKAETVALVVATPIDAVARFARPFIWLLSKSTNLVVRVLGLDPDSNREAITGEELRGMLAAHEELSRVERDLIDDVFDAGNTELREVMVPRTEVAFLDASLPAFRAATIVAGLPHSRYPVIRSSPDDVIGFVHVRDILAPGMVSRSVRLEDLIREVVFFPGSKRIMPALTEMRRQNQHLAMVADEYGGTAGIVTLEDIVEELVGDIHDEYDTDQAGEQAARLLGGPFRVDGLLTIEDFADEAGFELPDGPYETVAGWFMATLGRVPQLGDAVQTPAAIFEVVELDGRRVARIEVRPAAGLAPATTEAAAAPDDPSGRPGD